MKEKLPVAIFVSILFLSSFFLYKTTELYIETYRTLFSIRSEILEVNVLLPENTSETSSEFEIELKLVIYNPGALDAKLMNLHFSQGIFLNNRRLLYYEPKIFYYSNLVIPRTGEKILILRFSLTDLSEILYIQEANSSKEWNWLFTLFSTVRIEFKEDIIDLSSSFEGI